MYNAINNNLTTIINMDRKLNPQFAIRASVMGHYMSAGLYDRKVNISQSTLANRKHFENTGGVWADVTQVRVPYSFFQEVVSPP